MDEQNINSAGHSTIKIINQIAIADIIYRRSGTVSKAQLARELGLSKPAVSENVLALIGLGLVEERSEVSGDRRSTMLHFKYDHRYIGAFDFSLKEPVCAIGDLSHRILKLEKINVDRDASADTFKKMLNSLGISGKKLGVILISQPGIFGEDNDVKYLAQEYNVPLLLANDVKLSALGEMYESKDLQDLIYVKCGALLGAGIIVQGKMYNAVNCVAGEIGSFLCSNGRRLIDVVAMDGLLERVGKGLTFNQVVELSKAGDKDVLQAIEEIGQELGQAIYNISVLVGIPTIVFGGDYLHLGDTLFNAFDKVMAQSSLSYRPTVVKSSLRETAGIFGGFIMGREHIIGRTIGVSKRHKF